MNKNNMKELLLKIQEYGFTLVDLMQYLDTHPNDSHAIKYFNEVLEHYNEYHELFCNHYYPLKPFLNINDNHFAWATSPNPWETEAN